MEQYSAPPTPVSDDLTSRLVAATRDVFDVHSVRVPDEDGSSRAARQATVSVYGRLLRPSDQAYDLVASRFKALDHVALFRRSGNDHVIMALPGRLPENPTRLLLPGLLFLATLISVLFVGAEVPPGGLLEHPFAILTGWPFAASLLGILLAHELGHFVVARRLGVPSTLPYFIPLPISILGTMGAVIQLKAPPRNRRHLLAVAVAGPLAGLAVAIPVLIIGLQLSVVQRIPMGGLYFQEGNSLLYAGLKMLVFGRFLPSGGWDVFLHPVALAGWAGLLVTSLNLIPAAQLDGGHIANSLLGQHARVITWVIAAALLALAFLWEGWILWAALIFFFGRNRMEPLDDITALRAPERALALVVLIIFALVFTPIPMV